MIKTKLTKLFIEFFENEQASGIVLILCTAVSILLANSFLAGPYLALWHLPLGFDLPGLHLTHSLEYWINDGLMTIFFLLIGLEIERELYVGELSNLKNAALPIFAAVGGMLAPAAIHLLLNNGTPSQAGVAIPMATDIAFALGVLALLGSKIPASLKVFLTALAIIDDLGAIVIIAVFYVSNFSLLYFIAALAIFGGLLILNRLRVQHLAAYLIPGLVMWFCLLNSGVHATLAGVLLAFAIPFSGGGQQSPSYKLQHFLHRPVAFLIMPLFALANTPITLAGDWAQSLFNQNSLGIFLGLFAGKPLGISLASLATVKLRLARLPADLHWKHIVGVGFLGGIGFTMSIFITLLAFSDPLMIQTAKIAILLSFVAAGLVGYLILNSQRQPGVAAEA